MYLLLLISCSAHLACLFGGFSVVLTLFRNYSDPKFGNLFFIILVFGCFCLVMAVEKSNEDASCSWTREQDKAFENAIATYSEDSIDLWDKIAENVPGKSLEEIKEHYTVLIDDITEIESGRVPLPCYSFSSDGSSSVKSEGNGKRGGQFSNFNGESNNGSKGSRSDQERRKGIAWTEDEHKLFLLGLDKYGKGDWRSISRNFVVTRTPTQVASHAQKYFIRLNSMNKERRRSSIHDITTVKNNEDVIPQGPITGQTSKPPNQPSPPVTGTVVGTPVNLYPATNMAYGIRAPNNGPMTYPMTY